MASNKTWSKLKHFNKNSKIDQWGDTYVLDDTHLLRLDDFRSYIGTAVYVVHGVKTGGHAKRSYHYPRPDRNGQLRSYATDIIIPDYKGNPFDLILDATRFGFTGIGYYPYWKYRGKQVGGLHVDSRPLTNESDGTINYKNSRWMGVLNEDMKQIYIAMTFENILDHAPFPAKTDISLH